MDPQPKPNQPTTLFLNQPKDGEVYQCYIPSANLDHALTHYRKRYGAEPDQHFLFNHLLWLGPIPRSWRP